jgi:hypothetical protein
MMTGGRTATVTGKITRAAPAGEAFLGRRIGFSVADLGRRGQVGFTGVTPAGEPELTRCMAPGTFFTVQSGDFTVRDADHWQLDRPQGTSLAPFGM